jgi:ABC-type branched-subunit amino acid transport system substrate-binding protein
VARIDRRRIFAVDDAAVGCDQHPDALVNHQLKPHIGASIARRWYEAEKVDLIVGVPVSALGLAVLNVSNEKKKLFITHATGTADFHGKFCSPYGIQWVLDTRALAVGTAQEVVKRGGKTWFFLTDDYAFGHALERDALEKKSQAEKARWTKERENLVSAVRRAWSSQSDNY